MVKTAILVSGGGRNLQAIIDSRLFGEIPNCDLAAVIASDPAAYALTRAQAAGIDCFVVDRELFPNDQSFNEAIFHKLRDLDIDLVVLAGFVHRLSETIIRYWKNRIINVHPSLLPAFSGENMGGTAPHRAAIEAGVRLTGATAYFVSETPHTGPIILQQAVPVYPEDTPDLLQKRVMEQAEWSVLPQAVALYCAGALSVEDGRVKLLEQ